MESKRPYKHILKNLFHEQAAEIIPLLMPGYRVEQVLNIEMPELESTYIEGSPGPMGEGLVQFVAPGAQVLGMYKTRWIEHSGKFERAYRVHNPDPRLDRSTYLVIEFQTEREDKMLPRRLLLTQLRTDTYVENDTEDNDDAKQDNDDIEPDIDDTEQNNDATQDNDAIEPGIDDIKQDDATQDNDDIESDNDVTNVEHKHKGTRHITYVYPVALCQFPHSVTTPLEDSLFGKPTLYFNFQVLGLWEIDAREMLNSHVSAVYFLLPAMKNVDAALLGLAIEELVQRFQHDETELGRHLSGLHLMLQQSELMPEGEKLAAHEHLKRFAHLIKDDPYDD